MAKESIMRIAEAEKAAQEAEARAKAECEEIIRAAEAEAKKIADGARDKAQSLINGRIDAAKSAASAIEKDAANDAKYESAVLSKNADSGHDEAVRMVIETLVSQSVE